MDWLKELTEMIKDYHDKHQAAPRFGSYSKLMKKKIASKAQVQSAFLDNLLEMQILCDDDVVTEKIEALVEKYEMKDV